MWNDDAALRDPGITSWAVAHRTAALTDVAKALSVVGSAVFLVPLIAVCAGLFWWRRRSLGPPALLAIVWAVAWSTAAITKIVMDRPRPPQVDWLVTVRGASFPSQHAASSAAVFGMLAVLVFSRSRRGSG